MFIPESPLRETIAQETDNSVINLVLDTTLRGVALRTAAHSMRKAARIFLPEQRGRFKGTKKTVVLCLSPLPMRLKLEDLLVVLLLTSLTIRGSEFTVQA
jgi:hypothetical protein